MIVHPVVPDGIEIRELTEMDAIVRATQVFAQVRGGADGGVSPSMLRALASSGNYVVGIYEGDLMVGAVAAFFAPPSERSMHSHLAALIPGYRDRGLGRFVKFHQREWAFAHGVGQITWTFDPLVARNAHVNLRVLGARLTDYLVDQYGPQRDEHGTVDPSDRLLATWVLAAPRTDNPPEGQIVQTIAIPHDIEALRAEDPAAAAQWRLRVREAFGVAQAEGLIVGGFDDERGYLMVRS